MGILRKKYDGPSAHCWPEFDTTEQYIETLYRQFLIFVGFTIVPSLPLIALVGNEIKYYFDKWLLLLASKRRHKRVEGSNRSVLMAFLLSLALFPIAGRGCWAASTSATSARTPSTTTRPSFPPTTPPSTTRRSPTSPRTPP